MFDVPIDDVTMGEAIDSLLGVLDAVGDATPVQPVPPAQACFVNADCVNQLAGADGDAYHEVLSRARFVFADGSGMKLAGRILGQPLRDNVNGTDLFPRLCASLNESANTHSLFLLGGRPGVAEGVRDWIRETYPSVAVAGLRHGYFDPGSIDEVLAEIRASGARILLVAFGAPRQDLWIREQLPKLDVALAIGVGGLFDFYSGRLPRAPRWVRRLGMEWSFRLLREPDRLWRRYLLGNPIFVARTLRERFGPTRTIRPSQDSDGGTP
jgi:N-acetylglucosaminyldiphosphoundecaprenol N-acetyl-beta-D-mannosaminyltransferase